ncbi:MAG TPA: hypothetical protein VN934_05915 [Candidatus Tumulicola sp.]|nr:hypothetical protein [Candidatus Tumulicola sp.]
MDQLERWSPIGFVRELENVLLRAANSPIDTSDIESQIDMCIELVYRFDGVVLKLKGSEIPGRATRRRVDSHVIGDALKPVVHALKSAGTLLLQKHNTVNSAVARWQAAGILKSQLSDEARAEVMRLQADADACVTAGVRIQEAIDFLTRS